jgi:hypothetical protein
MKKLFKSYFAVIIFSGVAFSCTEEDPEATVILQDVIATYDDCTCDPVIKEYLWDHKTVYVVILGSTCNSVPIYYDENGTEFQLDEGYTFDEFFAESTLVRTVWRCGE